LILGDQLGLPTETGGCGHRRQGRTGRRASTLRKLGSVSRGGRRRQRH